MVVIAAVALVAILGFLVVASPRIGSITYDKILINNVTKDAIYCEDDHWGESPPVAYYRGSTRPGLNETTGESTDEKLDPAPNYDRELTVWVKDEDGNPMIDIKVKISGCGLLDSKRTDGKGRVVFSLEGCKLTGDDYRKFEGEIKIEATSKLAVIGQEQTKSITIPVFRPR
jgi:hypothetical protein